MNNEKKKISKIKIAVIDSGVHLQHPAINQEQIKGCSLKYENNIIVENDSFNDAIGHGTAITAIIQKIALQAQIISIRVFDQSLDCDIRLLINAVEKAIELEVDIIHFSLGIISHNMLNDLYEVCENATKNGIILIAASNNEGIKSFPAHWSNVIGIESDPNINEDNEYYYITHSPIEIKAKGRPQKVAWASQDYIYQGGNSFAAPYITGIVANILAVEGKIALPELRKLLRDKSKEIIGLEEDITVEYNRIHLINKIGKEVENKRKIFVRDAKFIKKAVVFPFSKEMHQLIKFANSIPFELVNVYDIRISGYVGVEPSKVILNADHKSPILNIDDIQNNLSTFDTIIIGHTHDLGNLVGRDLTKELLIFALENNKNVYCLDDLMIDNYTDIVYSAINKGLTFTFPFIDFMDLDYYKLRTKKLQKSNVPIIGVFGTGPHQGKFTTQILLGNLFKNEGYVVGQLGSEHQSLLMGFDEVFPMGFNSNVFVAHSLYVPILNQLVARIEETKKPDIIIVGAQSGTIPYDFYDFKHQTFPTLAFLSGTLPDLIVLHINYSEHPEYIRRTITVIENFGYAKVIACVLYGKKKRVNPLGRITYSELTHDEINEAKEGYTSKLGVPVFNTLDNNDVISLYETIMSYL